jgi:small ligand-binding sensory domain FIST
MICHLDDEPMSVEGWKMKFFQLDPDACKRDLKNSLQEVERQLAQQGKELLGGLMFSCSGRGPDDRFFGIRSADATIYSQIFPDAPLLGFYAGGEIGPQAMAIDDETKATERIGETQIWSI